MSSTIKLKKSSIAGRVPSASDLEYGEIAINIADGKLYFKNSSNAIQSFKAGDLGVDSATVLSLIDSSHIQARQIDEGLDSTEVNTLIASGLQNAFSRILVNGQFDVVSDSTQDGLTFEAGHNITITTVPNDDTITFTTSAIGADSVTSLIDSSFVQARQDYAYASLTGAPTSLSPDGVDSAATIALIDSAYIQARQSNGFSEGTVDAILVDGNSTSDATYDAAFWTAGSDTSGDGYNQGGGLSWNSTNGRVTVTSGGLYEIKFHAYLTASGGEANHNHRFQLWINGSNKIPAFINKYMATSHVSTQLGSVTLPLSAGDYIQIRGAGGTSWRPRVYNGSGHTYLQVIKQENGVLDTGIDSSTITSIIDSAYVSARAGSSGSSGVDSATTLNLFSVTTADPFAVTVGADSASFNLTSDVNHTEVPDLSTGLERNGLLFSDDGGVMYIADDEGITRRYTLSTAFDPESYTETSSNYIDLGSTYQSLLHRTTGNYVLSTNYGGDIIRLFTSSDGFDTFSYVGNSTGQLDTTGDGLTSPISAQFNADGTVLWVYDGKNTNVGYYRKYTLSTGYDLSTATYQSSASTAVKLGYSTVSGSSSNGEWFQFAFNNNGKIVFEYDGDNLALFRLATAYDLSSAGTLLQSYDKSSFIGSITNSHTAWQWVHTSSKNAIFTMPRNYNNMVEIPLNYTGSEGTPATPASLVYSADSGVYTYTPPKIVDSSDVISLIDSSYVVARNGFSNLRESNGTLIASGNILPGADSTYSIGTENLKFKDLFLSGGTIYIDDLGLSANDNGTITIGQLDSTGFSPVGTIATVDSTQVGTIVDSAYLAARLTDFVSDTDLSAFGYSTFDSTNAVGLIDSAYVQARQSGSDPSVSRLNRSVFTYTTTANQTVFTGADSDGNTLAFYDNVDVYLNGILLKQSDYNLSGGNTVTLDLATSADNILTVVDYGATAASLLDSSAIFSIIDSAHVQARQSTTDLTNYRTVTQIESMIDSNVNAVIDAAPGALNTLNELAAALGDDANFSTTVTNSIATKIDSDAAVGIITSYGYTTYDSSNTTGLIDSAYVALHSAIGKGDVDFGSNKITYSNVYSTTSDLPSASDYHGMFAHVHATGKGYFAHGGNWIELANHSQLANSSNWDTAYGWGDHSTQGYLTDAIDSARVTSLIDSSYIQARTSASGIDSATVFNLIDSAYILARDGLNDSSSLFTDKVRFFDFTADSGQTSFTGVKYTPGKQQVYLNGVLLVDSADYTATTGNTIVLTTAADSGNTLSVIGYETLPSAAATTITTFNFEADSGQTTFSGTADNGGTLEYTAGKLNVYLNGVLLVDSADYTATNGTSVVLNTAADSGNQLSIISYITTSVGTLDSSGVTNLIDSAYIQARQVDLQRDSGFVTDIIDSAYVQLRQSASSSFDSNNAIALIDSAYVQARQTAQDFAYGSLTGTPTIPTNNNQLTNGAGYITDYTVTEGDVTGHEAALTITESQISDLGTYLTSSSLTNYRTVTQIQSMIDSEVNSLVDAAPGALNTLNELAAALGDDANFSTTVTNSIAAKIDSAQAIALIDSAYVQARTPASGIDSAAVLNLIDSAYISARDGFNDSDTLFTDKVRFFNFTADSGQTSFTGVKYTPGRQQVYLNGVLLVDSADYTATTGSTIVLTQGADSGNTLSVIGYETLPTAAATTITTFNYEADSGQTTFSGIADNGGTLEYTSGKLNVYLNGVLLVDSADYTATNGTSVVLNTAADSGNQLSIISYITTSVGTLDSSGVTNLIDSAYVQARQSASSAFDSNNAIGLIDSAYVQARQTTQDFAYSSLTGVPSTFAPTGVDSSATFAIIDSDYIQLRQSSTDLTNYRTVTQIQSMIDSDVSALVDAAPSTLNTLNELAAALGDDANFSTTVTNSIAAKLPLAGGTMTGAIAMGSNKITGLGTPTATTDAATKAYADTMLPLAGGTMSGNIDLDNNELLNVNYLRFNDPGVEEGIGWTGGNGWQIFESPDNMTNASGNLQFTTGSSTSDRMMTIDTNGNLELPTGRLTQVSDDPLRIRSSTNASPVSIEFSDLATSGNYDQYGTISYTHSDTASTSAGISGANEIFIIEGTETVTGIKLDGRLLVTGTSEFEGDVDFGSNQITYSNVYSQTTDLPSASTYHGMFAHVHATGKGYFAHNGNWVELANNSDVPTDVSDLTDTTSLLGTGGLDSDATTNLIDSNYIAARTGNNSLTVNYVPDRKYARLTMSSDQTGVSSTTVALTTFNTRDVDTSPNNALTSTLADGKFIIPAGVSKIRLSASCKTSSVTDQVTMTFWKNGDFFTGASNIDVSSTGRDHAAAFTGIIDVVENDYFQIAMFSQNSRTAEQDELSWFELEVIEGSMLNTAVASTIELSNLSNVDSASPSDGQALVWDSDNNYWKPGTVASSGSGGLDSASTIALIDSAYIQARQTTGGSGTVDSADIIAIVDSDYIQARQSSTGSTTITSGGAFAARTYHYTASANQTNFTGADDNGDILAITDSDANVYLNGILLMRTTDYTVGSNSITLQSGADSDNIISIVSYTGQHLDSNYILSRVSGGATTTSFTATANQTVFSGGGFTYKPDNLTVFYNGILLLDSDDYTATDGTSITLTSGATAGHKLTAVAYTMGNAVNGVDVTTNTFTATSGQTVFNNLDDNGNRLSYNVGNAAIYLNGILLSPADYTANNSTRVVLTEAADSGNVLTVMSYAGSQQTTTADSSSWYEVSTTTYSAAATDKLFVDVSSAAATVTLPTSPSMGDEVRVIDATGNAATNNITIGRNGSKINGADSDLTLDIDRAAVGLVYYNAAQGWILMER